MLFRLVIATGLAASLTLGTAARAQDEKSYPDGKGGTVVLPLGDLSFADAVQSFEMGDEAPIEKSRDPLAALGLPDYAELETPERHVTLGCGGVLTLRFEDNALVDVAGTDLYVFEVGPDVEGTSLAISDNGRDWTEIGEISGGRSDIDIAPHVTPGASFSLVRLTDDAEGCRGRWPGADIDAVAAIGAGERIVLAGAVLFESDSAALRAGSGEALQELAAKLDSRDADRVRIVGHTDSSGPAQYNRGLSEERAAAVSGWLSEQSALADIDMSTRGAGESSPAAPNDTEEGRQKNRRVEVIVLPGR